MPAERTIGPPPTLRLMWTERWNCSGPSGCGSAATGRSPICVAATARCGARPRGSLKVSRARSAIGSWAAQPSPSTACRDLLEDLHRDTGVVVEKLAVSNDRHARLLGFLLGLDV